MARFQAERRSTQRGDKTEVNWYITHREVNVKKIKDKSGRELRTSGFALTSLETAIRHHTPPSENQVVKVFLASSQPIVNEFFIKNQYRMVSPESEAAQLYRAFISLYKQAKDSGDFSIFYEPSKDKGSRFLLVSIKDSTLKYDAPVLIDKNDSGYKPEYVIKESDRLISPIGVGKKIIRYDDCDFIVRIAFQKSIEQ